MDLSQRLEQHFHTHMDITQAALTVTLPAVIKAAQRIAHCLSYQGKILACGNGGSTADAQRFATEMINRFDGQRPGLAAVVLNTDTSMLTTAADQADLATLLTRQVRVLGKGGDILLAIASGGNPAHILAAIEAAQENGLSTVALTGAGDAPITELLSAQDVEIRVPSASTARIHELHLLAIHCLCDGIDQLLSSPGI